MNSQANLDFVGLIDVWFNITTPEHPLKHSRFRPMNVSWIASPETFLQMFMIAVLFTLVRYFCTKFIYLVSPSPLPEDIFDSCKSAIIPNAFILTYLFLFINIFIFLYFFTFPFTNSPCVISASFTKRTTHVLWNPLGSWCITYPAGC